MSNIAIQPMQWEKISDISEINEFSDKDETCFREVRDVLRRHNALDRFGMTLLHSHFDLAEDEVLLETTDIETRTQTVKPVKESEIDEAGVTVTNWKFTNGNTIVMRTCVCATTSDSHLGRHRTI